MYRIVLYAPDRHIIYEPSTAEHDGVGGGLTARLRLAVALADQGCHVTLVANLRRREVCNGVEYVPLSEARVLSGDVVIMNSTGGPFDLLPVLDLTVRARLRLIWVNNFKPVKGLDRISWDYLITPSNYVRRAVNETWGVDQSKLVVIHNGVPELSTRTVLRQPLRLIYTSHPSKGLMAALKLLTLLRQQEPRFELHLFGGRRLWGEDDEPFEAPEGVRWHGLVGQNKLSDELRMSTFAINLQSFEEAFGIALAEAMSTGCIVLASRVGAYPELIRDGYNGFLIDGAHEEPSTLAKASELIFRLTRIPEIAAAIRRNAAVAPLRWPVIAKAWIGFCERALENQSESSHRLDTCELCGSAAFVLSDGYHCSSCGHFARAPHIWA